MTLWCGRWKRLEDKLDEALRMLRLSAKREVDMSQQLDALLAKVGEVGTAIDGVVAAVDENGKETDEVLALLQQADDPAKIQEACDKLSASRDKLVASTATLAATNEELKGVIPTPPPPEEEPTPA